MKQLILIVFFFSLVPLAWGSHDLDENYEVFDRYEIFSTDNLFLGYTANMPKQPIGFYFCRTRPTEKQMGFYLSLKSSFPISPPESQVYDNISRHKAEDIFGDQLQGEQKKYVSINAGIVRTFSGKTAMYVGLGGTFLTVYQEYYDEFEILGKYGQYFIKAENRTYLNLDWGILLQAGRKIIMNMGFDVKPPGISLGIGYLLLSR